MPVPPLSELGLIPTLMDATSAVNERLTIPGLVLDTVPLLTIGGNEPVVLPLIGLSGLFGRMLEIVNIGLELDNMEEARLATLALFGVVLDHVHAYVNLESKLETDAKMRC